MTLTMLMGILVAVADAEEVPSKFFSTDYQSARAKFLDAARSVGAKLHHYKHPISGPDGNSLFTDVALVGPEDAGKVLVIISGTHGVEGFCGSGVQTGLLVSLQELPQDVRVVLIHAINPYGFAWLRRFNEDNVDLNRNFFDYTKKPEHKAYDELAAAIAPDDCSDIGLTIARAVLLGYASVHGEDALRDAITRGQYAHPKGLHYGGDKPAWSNVLLHKIVRSYIASATRVALIDVHTGLGEFGHAECIVNESPNSDGFRRAVSWWGKDLVRSTKKGDSVSVDVTGTLKYAFARMLADDCEVTATSLEFGTLPPHEVFFALQLENCLYHHADRDDPRVESAKTSLRNAFYPESGEWRQAVWKHSQKIINQALAGLCKESD